MNKTTGFGIVLFIGVLLTGFYYFIPQNSKNISEGSVQQSSEYQSTTTRTYAGVALTNLSVLKSSQGALGSIVLTGAAAGTINIYDSTSTVNNSLWATTTLATIPASAAAGTYTFDVYAKQGILVEIIGTAPTSTITFR